MAYTSVPTARTVDDSYAFLREGYTYISSRCDRLDSDVFETRLLLEPAYCMRGPEAAELFYGGEGLTRTGGMPTSAQHLLQDERSVQDLDGTDHRRRKELFAPMLGDDATRSFNSELTRAWDEYMADTPPGGCVVLYDAMNRILTTAALRWAGLPAQPARVTARTRELVAMIDAAGSIGPRNWYARTLRRHSEAWAKRTITDIRERVVDVPQDRMAHRVATWSDGRELLDPDVAAVELLNVLRPVVAVSRFVVFAAHALWRHPHWHAAFAAGDESGLTRFVHEVRRAYPFFPVIGARATADVDWRRHRFPAGSWLILDIYGTNHDPRVWSSPGAFLPGRFDERPPPAYALIPQGGGAYESSHRCPGEPLTVAAVVQAIRLLCRERYKVPAQDLSMPLSKLPTLPRSGFIVQRER